MANRYLISNHINLKGLAVSVLLGLVFTPSQPAFAQTLTTLYTFCSLPGCADGYAPTAGVIWDGSGNLYGTTSLGGELNGGVVFELSPNGKGGWNETVLHSFTGYPDGANPEGGLIMDANGNLYGTTQNGGTGGGYGTVFELSPSPSGWTETVLLSFGIGGANPCGAPIYGVIMDSKGNLYGATSSVYGRCYGIVFELSPSGGTWTATTIACCFYGPLWSPALVMDPEGNIFGDVDTGNVDEAFELPSNGKGGFGNLTVIHNFTGGKDGSGAKGAQVLDNTGNVYGTTVEGGAKNCGTVYRLTPGKKGWKEKILYSFKGAKHGSAPFDGVVLDAVGNIYGATYEGGKYGFGTVFELEALRKNVYTQKILANFNGTNGAYPYSNVILDNAGNLYGTTYGDYENGTVFEVTP